MMSCLLQNKNDFSHCIENCTYLVHLLVGNNMQNHSIPPFAQGYLDFLYE